MPIRSKHIFLNCPFDANYQPIFNALVFAAFDLGFKPRCALEVDDSGENRLEKIMRIIEECRYGVHDISAVALGTETKLPRFNMPLELGLYLGCKRFGDKGQRAKRCLVLDSEPYRYRASISDISGQDIKVHGGDPSKAVVEFRNWLSSFNKGNPLPGGWEVCRRYCSFEEDAATICEKLGLAQDELTFSDRCCVVRMWLQADR